MIGDFFNEKNKKKQTDFFFDKISPKCKSRKSIKHEKL